MTTAPQEADEVRRARRAVFEAEAKWKDESTVEAGRAFNEAVDAFERAVEAREKARVRATVVDEIASAYAVKAEVEGRLSRLEAAARELDEALMARGGVGYDARIDGHVIRSGPDKGDRLDGIAFSDNAASAIESLRAALKAGEEANG